jgi:hypothetical protein
MSRLPLMLISMMLLAGCSPQAGTGGGGGGGGLAPVDPDPAPVFPSSGLPDQNSFSVAVDIFNPRARSFLGTEVTLTARVADQLGQNTVPDGTEIFWAADGGAIDPICTTTNGGCTVTWISQNPRPAAGPVIPDPLGSGENVVSHSSARASILAWTLGTESFTDNNSNGLFDDAGTPDDVQTDDLPEAFIDKNENGTRDNNEEFVNYPLVGLGTGGGSYDAADGLYAGPNCAFASECATSPSVFNFLNIELAMSSDDVCIVDVVPNFVGGYWDAPGPTPGPTSAYDSSIAAPIDLMVTDTFYFLIHDCFGNPPMSETSVSFDASIGEDLFDNGGTVPNTSVDMGTTDTGAQRLTYPGNSLVYFAQVIPDPAAGTLEVGTLEVTVTTGAGEEFTRVVFIEDP